MSKSHKQDKEKKKNIHKLWFPIFSELLIMTWYASLDEIPKNTCYPQNNTPKKSYIIKQKRLTGRKKLMCK